MPHFNKTLTIDDTITEQIRFLCKKVFQKYTHDKIQQIKKGITNQLFKVDLYNHSEKIKSVLVRINGKGTEKIIDRDKEMKIILDFSKLGKGPIVYCTFNNGFMYQYFEGRALYPEDFRNEKISDKIARHMASMHKCEITSCEKEPILFKTLNKYYNVVKDIEFEDPKKQAVFEKLEIDKLKDEIDQLEKTVKHCDIGFGHNDLLSFNVILNEKEDKVHFIDFEYAGYNYRSFDIANHFCEFSGFNVDTSKYPTKEMQTRFIRTYLTEYNGKEPTDAEVENMRKETEVFALLSSLFWGLWALFQASCSLIDFDFLGYAGQRLNWFYEMKRSYKLDN